MLMNIETVYLFIHIAALIIIKCTDILNNNEVSSCSSNATDYSQWMCQCVRVVQCFWVDESLRGSIFRVVKICRCRFQKCRCWIVEKIRENKCQTCGFQKCLKRSSFVNNCWGYFRLIIIKYKFNQKNRNWKFFSIIGHIIMQYQFFPGYFGYYGELRKRFKHFPHQISMCLFRFRFFVFLNPLFPEISPRVLGPHILGNYGSGSLLNFRKIPRHRILVTTNIFLVFVYGLEYELQK